MTKHVLSYKFTAVMEGQITYDPMDADTLKAAHATVEQKRTLLRNSAATIIKETVKARTVREP